jgi:hypothetical protein
MYFDFEDYHPDTPTIGRVISWREGVLLSIIVHLMAIILLLLAPRLFPQDIQAMRARLLAAEQQRQDQPRFVFVQPRIDRPAPRPPDRAELSDIDRQARAPRRAERPSNPLPYSRGNSADRAEALQAERARGRGAQPEPGGQVAENNAAPESSFKAPELDAGHARRRIAWRCSPKPAAVYPE